MWRMTKATQQKIQTFFNIDLPQAHLRYSMAGEDQQRRAVAEAGTGPCRPTNATEEVRLCRTHPQEASIRCHTPGPVLEPAGKEKKGRPRTAGVVSRRGDTWQAAKKAPKNRVKSKTVADGIWSLRGT